MAAACGDDDELERQAQEMAEKALPATLPEAVRAAKLPAVKEKILARLKAQRGSAPPPPQGPSAVVPAPGAPPAGPPPFSADAPPPPPSAPPPPAEEEVQVVKVKGVDLCGDEPWFNDTAMRRQVREAIVEAHAEQKILVGNPREEIDRISPSDGRVLMAGGVLRLGGAHLGGYGESDIAYAYRQLSRALHPDKNPDVPNAQAAFQRLKEASEELKQVLANQRTALQLVVGALSGRVTPEMLERPQEAIFAEAARMLTALCSIEGEGAILGPAKGRGVAAFARASMFHDCQPQALLSLWFDQNVLLEHVGGLAMRSAYDCAQKPFRAQFVCLLNRAIVVEAKRCGDCVRGSWSEIMQIYPELGLWREFRERIQYRVWDSENDPPKTSPPRECRSKSRKRSRKADRKEKVEEGRRRRSGWDDSSAGGSKRDAAPDFERAGRDAKRRAWESRWTNSDDHDPPPQQAMSSSKLRQQERERRKVALETHPTMGWKASGWACKWRKVIAAALPSGVDGAALRTDPEVRKLGHALWQDIASWAEGTDAARGLGLFRADHQTPRTFGWADRRQGAAQGGAPEEAADWAFIPVADLLLVVGEGIVGITAEGVFADNAAGHRRLDVAEACRGAGGGDAQGRTGDQARDRGGERDRDRSSRDERTTWGLQLEKTNLRSVQLPIAQQPGSTVGPVLSDVLSFCLQ